MDKSKEEKLDLSRRKFLEKAGKATVAAPATAIAPSRLDEQR